MKQKLFYSLFLANVIAFAAGLMTSCTENLSSDMAENPIAFTIDGNSFEGSVVTRGAQVSSISNFGVSASVYDKDAVGGYTSAGCGSYFFNEQIQTATGRSNYFWPGSSYKVSFYAYLPYGNSALSLSSPKTKTGFPVYSYTVPTAASEQLDVMTAKVLDMAGTATTTPVMLTFEHKLADIRFKVTNQHPTDALTVSSIQVCSMKYTGTLENDTWTLTGSANSPSSSPFTFTPSQSVAAGATTDITGTANHFMVLPQTVASGTTIFVVKTTEYGSERTYTHVLTSDFTFEKAKSYTFTLILGDAQLIVDPETDINDWESTVQYVSNTAVGVNDWQ